MRHLTLYKLFHSDFGTLSKMAQYDSKLRRSLGNDVYLEILQKNDDYFLDLRKWTKSGEKLIPTTKGIRMSLECFVRLVRLRDVSQEFLDKVKTGAEVHEKLLVGGPIFIKIDSPFITIHIREYYVDNERKMRPGKKGIILKSREWNQLLQIVSQDMDGVIPGFSSMTPCYNSVDHSNLEGMMNCQVCNYFDACEFPED